MRGQVVFFEAILALLFLVLFMLSLPSVQKITIKDYLEFRDALKQRRECDRGFPRYRWQNGSMVTYYVC